MNANSEMSPAPVWWVTDAGSRLLGVMAKSKRAATQFFRSPARKASPAEVMRLERPARCPDPPEAELDLQ